MNYEILQGSFCNIHVKIGDVKLFRDCFVDYNTKPLSDGGYGCICLTKSYPLDKVKENIKEECRDNGVEPIEIPDDVILNIQSDINSMLDNEHCYECRD